MEAKDTVMPNPQLDELPSVDGYPPRFVDLAAYFRAGKKQIALTQAEITYPLAEKAGMRKVVEYAEMWGGYRLIENYRWQVKLKEWGIDA